LFAQSAAAAERVQDGGFDAATCNSSDCTSLVWAEVSSSLGVVIGPICSAGTTNCSTNGSAPFTPPHWARIGTGINSTTSAIQQTVQIPAGPARLAFNLRIFNSGVASGSFTVKVDGTPVFSATDTTPGYVIYTPVAVDVSGLAGGPRVIRFEGTSTVGGTAFTDSWDVDGVSVDAPDAPPPLVPAAGTSTPAAGSAPGVPAAPPEPPLARAAVSGFDFSPDVIAVGSEPTPLSAVSKGGSFSYTLSAPATVEIKLERKLVGRRKGRRCVKPKQGLKRKCTRYQLKGTLTRSGNAGQNTTPFSGRVGSRALPPGSYRATITATNTAGVSSAQTTSFRVVRA